MDTFIDKLAQKLTAQEMIRANSAADAAELSYLREQMAEYEDILKEIQEETEKNKESATKLQQFTMLGEQNNEKIARNLSFIEKYAVKTEQNAAVVEQGANALKEQVNHAEEVARLTDASLNKLNTVSTGLSESAAKVEENAAKADELIKAGVAKIESMQADAKSTEEMKNLLAELQKVQTSQFEQLADHVHKENVKVYRNVQAVMIEENDKQNINYGKNLDMVTKRTGLILGISIVSLLASCAGLAFQVLQYLHII